jgi:methionyl-tRNA formyltransferase
LLVEAVPMRLIMLGTGPFAVPTLRALAANRVHQIALVVTRPPTDRKKTASPLQRAGEEFGLPIWAPDTVNSLEAQDHLRSLAADLLVVCDYGEILRPETLATARLGGINLHGSLLPKFRGAAPVQWAILRGETETGVSIIQMTPGLDAGPLLAQARTPIEPDEGSDQLEARLAAIGAELVIRVVDDLRAGTTRPTSQDAAQASKAPRLKKEQGAIDWSRAAQEIKNQVRALRPWPRAYTFLHRENADPLRLNIDRVVIHPLPLGRRSAVAEEGRSPQATRRGEVGEHFSPGTILDATSRLLIATGDAPLEIFELQPAGKRSMPASDFLRGHRIQPGDRFG